MTGTPIEMSGIRPVMRALGDRVRWHIVELLAEHGELNVGALAELLPVAKTTVSYHIRMLSDSGVVSVRKKAQQHFVSVSHPEFMLYLSGIVEQLNRLEPL